MPAAAIPIPFAATIAIVLAVVSIAMALPIMRAEREAKVRERDRQYARDAVLGVKEDTGKRRATGLQKTLDEAGIGIEAGKGILLLAVTAIAAGLVASLFLGPVGFPVAAAAIAACAVLFVRGKRKKRLGRFEQQLGEALPMIAEGIRGGMTFEQSVRNATDYMDDPIREQFRRLAIERQYGVSLDDAVDHIAERTGSADMVLLTAVISVNQQTGGNMSDILDSVAETIQGRARLRKHVSSVTAMGRMSAVVIACVPLAVFAILSLTAPEYIGILLSDIRGWVCIGVSVGLIAIGMLIIRKLYDIKIY